MVGPRKCIGLTYVIDNMQKKTNRTPKTREKHSTESSLLVTRQSIQKWTTLSNDTCKYASTNQMKIPSQVGRARNP
ncbi:unnamed protein product [Dovyalis caffra]|uniref:Uncharacterized protein n=1 Tax=Dovyalis caffra TaxID=77055 RepID=A0AAV1RHP3_9ROSI|nr:unnamed protein product [Dovyalis caffra]